MSHRKPSAPRSSARRIAVSTIAATLLPTGGFCVNMAVAQAPKPATTAQAPKAAPAKPAAAAPAPAPAPTPAAGQQPPQLQLVYSPWTKYCGKGQEQNAKEFCITGRDGRTDTGQPIVAAALVESPSEPKKLFRITLPSPLQLQFGTRLVVDQDPPLSGAFVTCFGASCLADYEATPELLARLKKGQMLQIQAINLANAAIAFPLPLIDNSGSFQKANDGPPIDPKVFEEQQKKLQEDLQKRADELRKKLEAQQGGAK
jgi:invasion protein IalB